MDDGVNMMQSRDNERLRAHRWFRIGQHRQRVKSLGARTNHTYEKAPPPLSLALGGGTLHRVS